MSRLLVKFGHEPVIRSATRTVQLIKLGLSEILQQQGVRTALVESREENEALRQGLLADTRDRVEGLMRFQFRDRALWRHVKAVLRRASEQGGT